MDNKILVETERWIDHMIQKITGKINRFLGLNRSCTGILHPKCNFFSFRCQSKAVNVLLSSVSS